MDGWCWTGSPAYSKLGQAVLAHMLDQDQSKKLGLWRLQYTHGESKHALLHHCMHEIILPGLNMS